MMILYVVRLVRYDLLRAVGRLACRVSEWDEECDRKLYRLICYINSSLHLRMVGWIGDALAMLNLRGYADADLAGCADTRVPHRECSCLSKFFAVVLILMVLVKDGMCVKLYARSRVG
jgi:hypothetical protein